MSKKGGRGIVLFFPRPAACLLAGLLVAGCSLVPVIGGDSFAPPKSDLQAYWEYQAPESRERIDHQAWDRFLRAYVVEGDDGVRRVAYGRVTASDRGALNAYIGALIRVKVRHLNRNVQLPYWINLYNALTLKLVLDHYPIKSIREITDDPWSQKRVSIEGRKLSLNDIEHHILRPIWRDPRIHYALSWAEPAAHGPYPGQRQEPAGTGGG